MARDARPHGMWRPVPLPPRAPHSAGGHGDQPPLVAIVSPGASTPRATMNAPLLECVRESRLFERAYLLDLPHVWLYGLDDAGQPPRLASGGGDAEDIPTVEEAVALYEAAVYELLDREPAGCRLVLVGYSMSGLFVLNLWPRLGAYARARGRPHPAAVIVASGTDVPSWKKALIGEFFTEAGQREAGRYEQLRRLHGPHFDVILRCTRRWCGTEPEHTTSLFNGDPAHVVARVTDPALHFVQGIQDVVYEVADLFVHLTPPAPLADLSLATTERDAVPAVRALCARTLPAAAHPPPARPALILVPGDHFAVLAGDGLAATRAAVHYYFARIAGDVAVPLPLVASSSSKL